MSFHKLYNTVLSLLAFKVLIERSSWCSDGCDFVVLVLSALSLLDCLFHSCLVECFFLVLSMWCSLCFWYLDRHLFLSLGKFYSPILLKILSLPLTEISSHSSIFNIFFHSLSDPVLLLVFKTQCSLVRLLSDLILDFLKFPI